MIIKKIKSKCDGLELEVAILEPKTKPLGIVQISHGMAEHKERYFPFMEFLANHGYVCVIHDHRGHGKSVKTKEDLGYFYTKNPNYIVEDLYQVTEHIKTCYPNLEVFLFSHSMGTMVARCYLKKYDDQIKKMVLCGPPTQNHMAPIGILTAKVICCLKGGHDRSNFLQTLTFGKFNHGHKEKNGWVCSDPKAVSKYNQDELCGYIFTNNGFLNLYQLMKQSFIKKDWNVKNNCLPIFVIAGEKDPVIQSKEKFESLILFLKKIGYQNIQSKLYSNMRHELINGFAKEQVMEDILGFFNENA